MSNILIVDDEKIHKKGLLSLLEEICPEDMIWEASDGVEALEIMENIPCEIIISDIRMAKMDGLGLLREVKKRRPETFFIILSGYAEFSYAQEALALDAAEYLLKPVKSDELRRVVQEARTILKGNQEKKEKVADMEERLRETLPVYMEWLLNEFISDAAFPERESLKALLPLEQQGSILLTRIENLDRNACFNPEIKREMGYLIKNALKPHSSLTFSVRHLKNTLATLVLCSGPLSDNRLWAVQESLKKNGYPDVYFAASEVQDNLYENGAEMFEQVSLALSYSFYEKKHILRVTMPELIKRETELVLSENGLVAAIQSEKPGEALHLFDSFIKEAAEDVWIPPETFKRKIVFLFYRVLRSLEPLIETEEIPALNDMDQMLMEASDMSTLHAKGRKLIFCIMKALKDRDEAGPTPMERCREYLDQHYMDEISLEAAAKQFHFNPSYFSTLFKNSFGISFSGYLSDLRMKKALELLAQADYKVKEVAEIVGYKDANYFIRAFKKRYGKTPDEWRKGGVS